MGQCKTSHSKNLTFLSLPLVSKHSAFEFPLMGVSTSEVTERSDFGGHHCETVLAARRCLCVITLSDLELAGRRKTCD